MFSHVPFTALFERQQIEKKEKMFFSRFETGWAIVELFSQSNTVIIVVNKRGNNGLKLNQLIGEPWEGRRSGH